MAIQDPISDMLTRIRNGQKVRRETVVCPASKFRRIVLDVLKRCGYIRGYSERAVRKGIDQLVIELKYVDGMPAIQELNRVSCPGKRIYTQAKEMPLFRNGLGVFILSTSKGALSDMEARRLRVGGEIVCQVF